MKFRTNDKNGYCDDRCQMAIEEKCECSCDGANHGIAQSREITPDRMEQMKKMVMNYVSQGGSVQPDMFLDLTYKPQILRKDLVRDYWSDLSESALWLENKIKETRAKNILTNEYLDKELTFCKCVERPDYQSDQRAFDEGRIKGTGSYPGVIPPCDPQLCPCAETYRLTPMDLYCSNSCGCQCKYEGITFVIDEGSTRYQIEKPFDKS